jgi:hypothetical protein
VTLANQDLSLGSTIITLASTSSITSTTLASNALSQLQASIGNVSLALARMGAQVRQIENHNKFVGKLSDSIEAGIGNLVDADLASNSANWQWVAGCGADAAPFFRIFNPVLQGKKFDPEGVYVRRFVPELAGLSDKHIHSPWEAPQPPKNYPAPIVDLAGGRDRALSAFKGLKR